MDVLICDRSEMTTVPLASLLSIKPILKIVAPEVAAVSLFLPAGRTRDNAGGLAVFPVSRDY